MHGGSWEELTGSGNMKEETYKGRKQKPIDPIMMEEDQIRKIMVTMGRTHSGVPFQYKMNNKKRAISLREGLANDEEEVEDLRYVEKIEEILRATYGRKTGGRRAGTEGNTPIHVNVSVEPTTPCKTSTPERTQAYRQLYFSGR
jgi:hypothetical protein